MEKLPTWVKVVAALVIFAALYGGAQLLLHVEQEPERLAFRDRLSSVSPVAKWCRPARLRE